MSYISVRPGESDNDDLALLQSLFDLPVSGANEFIQKISATAFANGTSSGGGTVTSVSVTPANGVTGTVANPTTTPAISLTLEDITPDSVIASGVVIGSNLSGTNTGDQTSIVGITGTTAEFNTALSDNNFATLAGAEVLTNKTLIATTNVVEEITAIADSATPTPTGGSLRNVFDVTALAQAANFAAPSGTPANWNKLIIRIKDNGTARSLAWNSVYVAGGVSLPTTTVLSKILVLGFIYNTANSLNKWQCVASAQEA